MSTRSIAVFIVIGMLTFVACGKKAEAPPKQSSAVPTRKTSVETTEARPAPVLIQTVVDSRQVGTRGEPLPEGFPQDVFIVGGANVIRSTKQPDNIELKLLVANDFAATLGQFKQGMTANGWTLSSEKKEEESAEMKFSKTSERRGVVLKLVSADVNTEVEILACQFVEEATGP